MIGYSVLQLHVQTLPIHVEVPTPPHIWPEFAVLETMPPRHRNAKPIYELLCPTSIKLDVPLLLLLSG